MLTLFGVGGKWIMVEYCESIWGVELACRLLFQRGGKRIHFVSVLSGAKLSDYSYNDHVLGHLIGIDDVVLNIILYIFNLLFVGKIFNFIRTIPLTTLMIQYKF